MITHSPNQKIVTHHGLFLRFFDDTCLGSMNILRFVAPSEAVTRQQEKTTGKAFIVDDRSYRDGKGEETLRETLRYGVTEKSAHDRERPRTDPGTGLKRSFM
jgi:hypothetical protein